MAIEAYVKKNDMGSSQEGNSSSISCWLYEKYFAEETQDPQRAGYQKFSIGIEISHIKVYQKLVKKIICYFIDHQIQEQENIDV